MLIRRIAISACALSLAVPALAVAQPIHDPAPAVNRSGVAYGDTKYDLQNQQDEKAAKPAYADRVGSLSSEQLAAAYGTTQPKAPASTPVASDGDGTNVWRIAAVAEAGLLAAFAFGSVAVVRARRRVVA